MSIKAIAGLVIAVAVVGGAIWYYSNGTGGVSLRGDGVGMEEKSAINAGSGPLSSLFAMSGSHVCAINSRDPNSETDGVVYISNGSVRGDFISSVSAEGGQNVQAHMIKSGNDFYVWSDVVPQGIKLNAAMMIAREDATSASPAFDPNVSVDYSCEPTTLDVDLFVAPAEVQFMAL